MPRKSKFPDPEAHRAQQARYRRLVRSTTAAINAGIDAYDRGVGGAKATAEVRAAIAAADAPKGARRGRARSARAGAALPRLAAPGWTADTQREFLVHLSETGCVSQACELVGMSRQSAYALRRRVPNSVFAVAWDVAIYMARQAMLDEATERAIQGREVGIWYHGEQVGTRTVHNDKLLMFLLGLKREALHPRLDAREMTQLFPTMLRMTDTILPHAFSPERIAELTDADPDSEDF